MYLQKMINSLKGLFLLSSLLFILTFSASNTFADFYVIAGSRGVGTKITALPYTIASPGFYFIAKDLSCLTGNHGITITADNVTLDLMGFSLIGPGGSGSHHGIFMNLIANVEIRNGTVRDFNSRGIYEFSHDAIGHRIINVRVKDNYSYGIGLEGYSHLVEKCTAVCNSSVGIYAMNGSTITGNTCYNNTNHGIYTGYGSTVAGNTCYANGDDGIYAGYGSTVIGNTCRSNTNHGISLQGSNFVDQNTATSNGTDISACGTCIFGTNLPNLTNP